MTDLSGFRALIIEDEGPIALLIEDMLLDLGCEIIASAAELETACEIARTAHVDFALLDLNLNGLSALPVAHVLHERGIPFVFSTGYGVTGLSDGFESYPTLAKPFVIDDLCNNIVIALGQRRATSASQDPDLQK
jgi:DNA-binding response OmpR family regulator